MFCTEIYQRVRQFVFSRGLNENNRFTGQGWNTHTHAAWNLTSLMQAFVLLLRVYLKRKTSCTPGKIYSTAVQALSIQTRRSLPAVSQRHQHSCLQQHCRPLRAAWTVTICNAMRFHLGGIFIVSAVRMRVHGTEMRLNCTCKSWSLAWNRQLFSLCGSARIFSFFLDSSYSSFVIVISCILGLLQ